MSAEELMELSGSSQIFDAAFHPTADLLATALITGNIEVWKLPFSEEEDDDEDESDVVLTLEHHSSACRGLQYFADGRLLSISADLSWALIDPQGRLLHKQPKAHQASLNKVALVDEVLFASGDDAGVVKLWDTRAPKTAALSWDAHTDFVSALEFAPNSRQLFSTAGDATLCVYDIRNAKNFYKSDDQEAELTALCVLEDRKLVVCGTDEGALLVFKWGLWGDCSDRFPAQSDSVNSLARMRDGRTLLAGGGDGRLCAFSLYPMRRLGELGALEPEGTVEGMALRFPCISGGSGSGSGGAVVCNGRTVGSGRADRSLLAAFAYSERVVLWDVTEIEETLASITLNQQQQDDSDSDSDGDDDDDDDSEAEEAEEVSVGPQDGDNDSDSDNGSDNDDDDEVDSDDEDEEEDGEGEEDDDEDDEESDSHNSDDDVDEDDDDDEEEQERERPASAVGSKRPVPATTTSITATTTSTAAASSNTKRPSATDNNNASSSGNAVRGNGNVSGSVSGGRGERSSSSREDGRPQKRLKTDSERFYADL